MPPKAKMKGKGKKKEESDPVEPTEKEFLLKKELEALTKELSCVKKRVEELRKENGWLQEETQRTKVESHEYMSYMAKKAQKRQTTIVTLSDQNQHEIRNIHQQREDMLAEFENRKQALRDTLMSQETELALVHKELDNLHEFKVLREQQIAKIEALEREELDLRSQHTETIQKLKSQFLTEKRDFQIDSEARIQEVAKEANKEAMKCLQEHTNKIKLENRRLRKELLKLIQSSRNLQEHKEELVRQKKELLREQEYASDLKKIQSTRQHKVLKSLGLLDEQAQGCRKLGNIHKRGQVQ